MSGVINHLGLQISLKEAVSQISPFREGYFLEFSSFSWCRIGTFLDKNSAYCVAVCCGFLVWTAFQGPAGNKNSLDFHIYF